MIGHIWQNAESSVYGALRQEGNALKETGSGTASSSLAGAQESVSGRAQQQEDTAMISQKARNLSESSGEKEPEAENLTAPRRGQANGEESGTDLVKEIRKQIQEVKKELQEATLRLAEARAAAEGASETQPGNAPPKTTADANTATQSGNNDPAGAVVRAAVQALSGNAGVEAAQAEVDMLNQRLLMLNNQLQEAMGGSGGSGGAAGSAGLGGSGGSGGLGERIEVIV